MAPHLTAWDWSLTGGDHGAIINRGTGIALGVGVIGVGVGSLVAPSDIPTYTAMLKDWPLLLMATKAAVTFPFAYHTGSGFRHLYWKFRPQSINCHSVERGTWSIVGASALLAGLAGWMTF